MTRMPGRSRSTRRRSAGVIRSSSGLGDRDSRLEVQAGPWGFAEPRPEPRAPGSATVDRQTCGSAANAGCSKSAGRGANPSRASGDSTRLRPLMPNGARRSAPVRSTIGPGPISIWTTCSWRSIGRRARSGSTPSITGCARRRSGPTSTSSRRWSNACAATPPPASARSWRSPGCRIRTATTSGGSARRTRSSGGPGTASSRF